MGAFENDPSLPTSFAAGVGTARKNGSTETAFSFSAGNGTLMPLRYRRPSTSTPWNCNGFFGKKVFGDEMTPGSPTTVFSRSPPRWEWDCHCGRRNFFLSSLTTKLEEKCCTTSPSYHVSLYREESHSVHDGRNRKRCKSFAPAGAAEFSCYL